eukprot:scaffold258_cov354-Prasinococcus_capsulatus_cf.AAC.11
MRSAKDVSPPVLRRANGRRHGGTAVASYVERGCSLPGGGAGVTTRRGPSKAGPPRGKRHLEGPGGAARGVVAGSVTAPRALGARPEGGRSRSGRGAPAGPAASPPGGSAQCTPSAGGGCSSGCVRRRPRRARGGGGDAAAPRRQSPTESPPLQFGRPPSRP